MKACQIALLVSIAWMSACGADEPSYSPFNSLLIYSDWQYPSDLPRRFRNHCGFDVTHARYYCSDHCGPDYQFYHCSRKSFGCCHIGVGYCDWNGHLRCRP